LTISAEATCEWLRRNMITRRTASSVARRGQTELQNLGD